MEAAANGNNIQLGCVVEVAGSVGVIRFLGKTEFAPGTWAGIELREPTGKNNGSVQGVSYFSCEDKHGLFVRASAIKNVLSWPESSKTSTPASGGLTEKTVDKIVVPEEKPGVSIEKAAVKPISALDEGASVAKEVISKSESPKVVSGLPLPGERKRSSANSSPAPSGRTSLSAPSATSKSPANLNKPSPSGSPALQRSGLKAPSSNTAASSSSNEVTPSPTRKFESPQKSQTSNLLRSPSSSSLVVTPQPQRKSQSSSESVSVSAPPPVKEDVVPVVKEVPVDTQLLGSKSIVPPSAALSKELDELKLKLKVMEGKRSEEREKLRELEKIKTELEESKNVQGKLQSKVSSLQLELKETQKQYKEFRESHEDTSTNQHDLLEQLEIITLDREMAEEKAEALQHELEITKEKLEEMKLNLEILQHENELMLEGGTGNAEDNVKRDAVELLQLQKQNERLKEALVKLRDVTSAEDAEKTKKIKELEKELSDLTEIKSNYEKTASRLEIAEGQIDELKESLEAAMEAEEMVETLSLKIITLEEKYQDLKEANEDLENLKEVTDELEEQHIITEKLLRQENDALFSELNSLRSQLETKNVTIADFERTILQFRELVKSLQSDLSDLRSREESQKNVTESLSSQSKEMMSLNLKLQNTVLKSQAKQLELELKKLQVSQKTQHLEIMKNYLSRSYFEGGDAEAVSFYLSLERISTKAVILLQHFETNYHINEQGSVFSTLNDGKIQLTTRQQLQILMTKVSLSRVHEASKSLISHIRTEMDAETFLKTVQLGGEVKQAEKILDSIIEAMMVDEFIDHDNLPVLKQLGQHVTTSVLNSPLFQGARNHHKLEWFNLLDRLKTVRNEFELVTKRIQHTSQTPTSELANSWKKDPVLADLVTLLISLPLPKISAALKRAELRATGLSVSPLSRIESKVADSIRSLFDQCEIVVNFIQRVHDSAFSDEEGPAIKALISKLEKELLGKEGSTFGSSLLEFISQKIEPRVNELVTMINDQTIPLIPEDAPTEEKTPWKARGTILCANYEVNHEAFESLKEQEKANRTLLLQLQAKDEALEDVQVKLLYAQNKIETLKSDLLQIDQLKEQLAKVQEQEKMYEEAMDSVHADVELLERRLAAYREIHGVLPDDLVGGAGTSGGSGVAMKKSHSNSNIGTGANASNSNIIPDYSDSIDNNINYQTLVIQRLRLQVSKLKSKLYLHQLNLDLDKVPIATSTNNHNTEDNVLEGQIGQFKRDLDYLSSSFRLVSVNRSSTGKALLIHRNNNNNNDSSSSSNNKPIVDDACYGVQASLLGHLVKQATRLQDLNKTKYSSGSNKCLGDVMAIGKLKFPASASSGSCTGNRKGVVPVHVDYRQLRELHQSLLISN